MSALKDVAVQTTVVLGSTYLPIRQVLKMGRGAMIPLDRGADDLSELHVNGVCVARGVVQITGDAMALEIIEMVGGTR